MATQKNPLGFADPRETLAAVKDVVEQRQQFKRPIRLFTLQSWPNGEPMLRLALTVAVSEKTCVYFDSALNEHRIELADGGLDFSQGIQTVKLETLNEDGSVIDVSCLSHDTQYAVNFGKSDFNRDNPRIVFYRGRTRNLLPHKTPNAFLPTCYPENGSAKIVFWQRCADAPTAKWLDADETSDGKPTLEDIEGAQKVRDEARTKRANARQADAVPAGGVPEDGPASPSEVGEDF